jgi:2-polyprenyl-3-methyl-5-hydroxy-6-metoxy-1,4-benzoquinol methylase
MGVDNKSYVDTGLLYAWSDDDLRERHQKRYLRYLVNAPGRVLDIGSGRGVMLRLMKEAGITAYGIDSFEDAVIGCKAKGLDVVYSDALSHLSSLPSASLGGIFCAHVIEHMQPAQAIELIRESFRVLKPGARIVIITPNPKDLRTGERFWLDVTHVRPYPEKLLLVLMNREGFVNISTHEDGEPTKNIIEKCAKAFLKIWFMGFMFRGDLVVVADRR